VSQVGIRDALADRYMLSGPAKAQLLVVTERGNPVWGA